MHQQCINTLWSRCLHTKNISLSYPSNLPQNFSQGFCEKDWKGFHFVCKEQERMWWLVLLLLVLNITVTAIPCFVVLEY